jgi:tetratricopeptide (TPR) repeat protein
MWKGLLRFVRGDWTEALTWFERGAEEVVPGVWAPIHPMFLARHLAKLGDVEAARRLVEQHRPFLPRPSEGPVSMGSWVTLALSVETLVELGEDERAAELYPLTLDYLATGSVGQPYDFLPVESVAGLAAAAGGRWDDAESHFRRALEAAAAFANRVADPEIRYRLGAMLLGRNGPGDRENAVEMLGEAIARHRALDMPEHVKRAEHMLDRARS